MMEGLVIFNIFLWPWLAYWCLVVASLASQLLRSLSSSLSLIIMMMIDDDWWWWWWQSFQIFLIALVLDFMVMMIFSDLPHCLCPSSVVSCHWPLLPKMGWFVIINLVIVKLFVFFSIEPAACIQQVGVRSISLPLPLPMQTKLKFYRSFWLIG